MHNKDISDAGIDVDQARSLFNQVKEEANIVASSRRLALFSGKITSRLSQIPLIGHVVSGMSSLMRSITKMVGDKDVNKEENGKTILDKSPAASATNGAGAGTQGGDAQGGSAQGGDAKAVEAAIQQTEAFTKQDETPNGGASVEPPKAKAEDEKSDDVQGGDNKSKAKPQGAKPARVQGQSKAGGSFEQNAGQKGLHRGYIKHRTKKARSCTILKIRFWEYQFTISGYD